MEEKAMHIVIVGHVDHGKSTLIGRLLYDTGYLPPEKVEEIRRASESFGRDVEFAYTMDTLEEEREKGITIDTAHTFFSTSKRRYVIIDAPGHKEFLKNMVSGSSQAEAALLIIDASRGVQEQTLRHCHILGLLGIRQVVVLINKMDLVDYSEDAFRKVREGALDVLSNLGINPGFVLPISARLGENVAVKAGKALPWYSGPTVLEALDSFSTIRIEEKGLRFPVQDIYNFEGTPIAVGRVESGVLRKHKEVTLLPGGPKFKVSRIMKYEQEDLPEAETGECVGIVLEGAELKRGQILAEGSLPAVTDRIRANIFWMIDKEYKLGTPLIFRCSTQEARGRIEKIHRRYDPASIDIIEHDASVIKHAEIAEVEIKLDQSICMDNFNEIPEMGRFVLEYTGHHVVWGTVFTLIPCI